MSISGAAKIAGVMGWPVDHSLSPRLHGYWLRSYGIDGAYVPLPVQPDHLSMALRALPALGFVGANLTVPHKEAAIGIVDHCDESTKRIGAINTVIVGANGSIEGCNTDGLGFLKSVCEGVPGWQATDGPVVIIGAGGAARAICAVMQESMAPEIRIVNRTAQRAAQLARDFGPPVTPVTWADRASALSGASLVVNATVLGMRGQSVLDLNIDNLPVSAVVADIVYVPLETPLLREAKRRGNRTIDGLGMLLHQACPGFLAWYGHEPEVTPALRQYILGYV